MATLQELMAGLKNQRDRASENSPVATTLGKAVSGMNLVASAVSKLHGAIEDQVAANLAVRKTGESKDVQQIIRNLLQAKVAENTIERERNKRMMDMAERVVPQVTEEQLETLKLQQEAYRAHKKEMAEAEFAVTDKYRTLESAVGGLESKAQDPFSKYIMSGLGRFIKDRQGSRIEDTKERFAISAGKAGISDPGSASKLFADREQQVKALATLGSSIEKSFLSGKATVSVPNIEGALNGIAGAINKSRESQAEVPILTRAEISEKAIADTASEATVKEVLKGTPPVATGPQDKTVQAEIPAITPNAPPANARFEKAPVQGTRPMTPAVSRPPQATVTSPAVGVLGSKAGAVNLAGIGSALGGITTQLGSLAGSAVKFLGPWGLIASAFMSFDRMIPILSTGAGALMDMAKILIPLTVTQLIEGFANVVAGLNGIINMLPGTKNLDKMYAGMAKTKDPRLIEAENKYKAQQAKENAITEKSKNGNKALVVDTTSVRANVDRTNLRQLRRTERMRLTNPSEASAIEDMSRTSASARTGDTAMVENWKEQVAQNQIMRETVMEAARNPGTTPIVVQNPYAVPWFA